MAVPSLQFSPTRTRLGQTSTMSFFWPLAPRFLRSGPKAARRVDRWKLFPLHRSVCRHLLIRNQQVCTEDFVHREHLSSLLRSRATAGVGSDVKVANAG